jgi:hypothetical protein
MPAIERVSERAVINNRHPMSDQGELGRRICELDEL